MARFNTKEDKKIKSYEGGTLYKRDIAESWLNFLFSSFLSEEFYESSKEIQERFLDLTDKVAEKYGYTFIAKAAIFARNELGMRTISQLTAAWLNDKTFQEKRRFYREFMRRPDDVSEIFAATEFLGQKRSHALVRGCGDYLSNFSAYQITKF